jgi:hypothetical protein
MVVACQADKDMTMITENRPLAHMININIQGLGEVYFVFINSAITQTPQ